MVDFVSYAINDAAAELSKSQAGSSDQVSASPPVAELKQPKWKVGDKCMAMWSDDQNHYEATIEEILNDGTCTVTFEAYGNTDVTEVLSLFLIYQF
ncbi:hypothetical protein LSH36_762g00016 [Paralvinella palmiformis]|uniref:Tudor domain-containing protein n=1 Tax=Paralvinella palmiformis TaxID=53620 RepID=A0AAD9MT19_9ANNE|nr:hypothetical protein LSH36_762g00016 [Paralvinella palmiformis]